MAVLLAAAMLVSQVLVPFESGDPFAPPVPAPTTTSEEEPEAPMAPQDYLYATYPRLAKRLDCVITRESGWDTWAINRRSGAAGIAQFLLSTWLSTPQGRAGHSRHDPIASIDASVWLATNVGWKQWEVVLRGYC